MIQLLKDEDGNPMSESEKKNLMNYVLSYLCRSLCCRGIFIAYVNTFSQAVLSQT